MLYSIISSEWNLDLTVKPNTTAFLEENIGEKLCDFCSGTKCTIHKRKY